MAIAQSDSFVLPPGRLPQSPDLLDILRQLDEELDLGCGIEAGQALRITFPINCARAFLRAHEALKSVNAVSPAEECGMPRLHSTSVDEAAGDLLNPDRVFSTTRELTAWITSIEHYVEVYLEVHRSKKRAESGPAMTTIPPIPGRCVIQIAAIPESTDHSYGVFALCDDRTTWEAFYFFGDKSNSRWGDWEQIPAVPGAAPDLVAALTEAAAIVHDQLNVIMSSSTARDGQHWTVTPNGTSRASQRL